MLQKGLKIGPSDCIQMSETSELPGAPPPGPHQAGAAPQGGRGATAPLKVSKKGKNLKYVVFSCIKMSFSVIFNK